MSTHEAFSRLVEFRQEVYATALGQRKESLFEVRDAVCVGDGPTSLVGQRLTPVFRRQWPSVPDALAGGTRHAPALPALLASVLSAPPVGAGLV